MALASLIILTICIALIALLAGAIPRRAAPSAGIERQPADGHPSGTEQSVIVATYNIHGAKGTDGRRDLARTAQAMAGVDIAALQEVRAGWCRNQAVQLARTLQLGWLFVPTLLRWYRHYRGNALLTRYPVSRWQTHPLPNVAGHRYRAFTVAEVDLGRVVLSVLFTHLHTRQGRQQQLGIVLEHFRSLKPPAVLLGDLNTKAGDPVLAQYLAAAGWDALDRVLGERDTVDRVDWVLTRGVSLKRGGFTDSGASDHPYYWVEVVV